MTGDIPVNEAATLGAMAKTAAALFLVTERHHTRGAVVQRRDGDRWETMPDWRFERHVLRMALYMRERAGVQPGNSVAVVAPIGPEQLVAEWASLVQGLRVAALDASGDEVVVRAALRALAPRVLFAADARVARTLEGIAGVERVIVLRGEAEGGPGVSYREALDLGGTLDTAERAQTLRAIARAVSPTAPALAWTKGVNGSAAWESFTHDDLVTRIRQIWLETPPRTGAVRYFALGEARPTTRIELHACVADGATRIAFGAPPTPLRTEPKTERPGWFARVATRF